MTDNISEALERFALDAADIGWAKRSLGTDGASMRDILAAVASLLDSDDAQAKRDARAILAEVLR